MRVHDQAQDGPPLVAHLIYRLDFGGLENLLVERIPVRQLRKIAETVADDQGAGAVGPALGAAAHRLIGFELQFGPFAVAQLRLMAEMRALMGAAATGTGARVP